MKAYSYSIFSNTGGWGGCHSRIHGYTLNPVLAMIRGFKLIKKEYPDEDCKKEWNFDDYHIYNDENRKTYAGIHNTTKTGTDVSVFIEEINIEETPDNLEELVNSLYKEE